MEWWRLSRSRWRIRTRSKSRVGARRTNAIGARWRNWSVQMCTNIIPDIFIDMSVCVKCNLRSYFTPVNIILNQAIECRKCSQGVSHYRNRTPPPYSVIGSRYKLKKKGYERIHVYTSPTLVLCVYTTHTHTHTQKQINQNAYWIDLSEQQPR
jgi:hypothetical protein